MKALLLILAITFSVQSLATVEVCSRKAQVAFGLFSHMWIKTDTVEAGMGGPIYEGVEIGDVMELPYVTKVYVRDHSGDTPDKCEVKEGIDEECVNKELVIDKPLGHWRVLNQCQSYVAKVIRNCEYPWHKERRLALSRAKRLIREIQRGKGDTFFKERQLERLIKKYDFDLDY